LPRLKALGINAATVTYDSREALQRFTAAYKIEYPMLSDVGSKVIRAFGILNTNVPPDHKMMYGIPWPGDYLLAPDGTVRDKAFLPSYEHRVTASAVLVRNFGADAAVNSVELKTDALTAVVSLSADRCFPGQELGVALRVHLNPGWHIYGQPLPASYQTTELSFASALIDEQSLAMPAAAPMELKALGETLPVYENELQALGRVHVRWSPPMPAKFLLALGEQIQPGLHQIEGALRFQACNDQVCEPPQTLTFKLPLTIEAGVPSAPKSPE
jgi:AhpC/TSA family/Thiol:disulfide interchange protein DsbD, N-terminal